MSKKKISSDFLKGVFSKNVITLELLKKVSKVAVTIHEVSNSYAISKRPDSKIRTLELLISNFYVRMRTIMKHCVRITESNYESLVDGKYLLRMICELV